MKLCKYENWCKMKISALLFMLLSTCISKNTSEGEENIFHCRKAEISFNGLILTVEKEKNDINEI